MSKTARQALLDARAAGAATPVIEYRYNHQECAAVQLDPQFKNQNHINFEKQRQTWRAAANLDQAGDDSYCEEDIERLIDDIDSVVKHLATSKPFSEPISLLVMGELLEVIWSEGLM